VSVTRDSQAPAVTIAAPSATGTFVTNTTSIALSGKATDNTAVTQVTWQNSRGGAGAAVGTADWAVPAVALVSGANVITVTARDAAGNAATATLTVTLDTRAPVLSITAPTHAAAYPTNESTITLGGVASDDVALAEVTWSNSQGGNGVAVGTSAWSVNSIALKPGLNTLTVTARDTAGNTTSATLAVRVTDVKAPTVRIVAPSADAAFSTAVSAINLEGVAADDFGVARITWTNDRGGSGAAKGDSRWIAGGLALQPGLNVITVTATDTSGNASTDVVRITSERGLPTIALTSPTTAATYAASSSSVSLTGVASDDFGVVRVTWSTDKGQVGVAVGTTTWSIPSVSVPLGTTVVTVTAHDSSGNTSNLTLTVVNADATKPTVKIYTPTTAAAITMPVSASAVTLAGTASDNVGITRVTWATDRGASGAAFGSGSWSTPSIALGGGTTVITVTAHDAAGNTGVAVLSVTAGAKAETNNTSTSLPSSGAASSTGTRAGAGAGIGSTSTSTSTLSTGYDATSPTAPSQPLSGAGGSRTPLPTLPTSAGSAPAAKPQAPSSAASEKAQAPAVPPVVRFVAPTAAGRFTTTASALTVTGIANHASGISVVRWSTDKGDSGVADGTTKWTVAGIPIKAGTTVVTVSAASTGGDTTNAVLLVERPEPLPKLSITSPTADWQWTSGTGTVALKGSATDNVTRVTWSSDAGAAGVAQGTTSWAIAGIGLQPGINRITVTAQDAGGRTDRHVLTITYRPRSEMTAAAAKLASQASAGLE
jgi:hypothetical protein